MSTSDHHYYRSLTLNSAQGWEVQLKDRRTLIWGSDLEGYRTFSLQIIMGGNYPQSPLKHRRWVFCYPPRLWVLFTLLFLDLLNLGVCFPSVFLLGVISCWVVLSFISCYEGLPKSIWFPVLS